MANSTDSSGGGGQSEQREIQSEDDRSMGFASAAAIGIGTMIAAGIFVLSGLAVSNVGTVAIVSFLLAALVASITAGAYAEFSSIYPESGGGYVYVARTIPSELSYLMGWTMILGYPASAAFYLGSFAKWFYEFLYAPLNVPAAIPYWVAGLLVLAVLVGLNIAGAEEAGQFQIVVTSLKVILIAVFLVGAFQAFDASVVAQSFSQNIGDFADIGVTSALVFITFFGFSAIATDAEEIRDPGSTIPRAIYFSMAFVSVVYALVVIAIVLAVNDPAFVDVLRSQVDLAGTAPAAFVAEHGELAMGLAARTYLGAIGFYIIVAGALISMLSAANATILAGSRVKLALARNGHLPSSFEDTHDRWGTPYKSVLLTGGLILLFLALFTVVFFDVPGAPGASQIPLGLELGLEGLANFANFLLITGLSVVDLALIRSRQRFPDLDRGFEMPLVPWLPLLGVLGNVILLGTIVFREPAVAALAVLAELVGVVLWAGISRSDTSDERLESETPTVVSEHSPTDHDHRLIVSVADEANVDQLMRTATDLVSGRDAEIVVMNAIDLPAQTPYAEGRDRAEEARPVVDRAMEAAEEAGVPVNGTVRLTHDPADAILNTVEQYDGDAVLMGWGGHRSTRGDIALSDTVDEVVTEADADVYVEKVAAEDGEDEVDSILLPWTDGPHSDIAAETAAAIARTTGATVDAVYVAEDADDAESTLTEAEEKLADQREDGADEFEFRTRAVEADDVADTLVDEAADHEVVTLGSEREGILQKLVFGTLPEAIGDRVDATAIMCQRNVGAPSRLARFLP